jgi:dTDP-4-dehydrorhamnose 3,5-epimerase
MVTPAATVPAIAARHARGRSMDVSTTAIEGMLHFTTTPHRDDRGFFCRTFDADLVRAAGLEPAAFVQDSLSRSRRGVVRGMHVRTGRGEAKLVRCSYGQIFDVVVDLRHGSTSYLSQCSVILDGELQNSIYVPPGCAHGFQALTEVADTSYRIDRPHNPTEALAIAHDDPDLAIPWPLPVGIVSETDRAAPPLSQLGPQLSRIVATV